ncbi:hypothetical protein MASR2M117_00980 [Paludibacter sp.]
MLKRSIYLLIILSGLFLISCDPDEINGDSKNYWETNAWVRLQLKGKVKSVKAITDYEEKTTNFNDNGVITSILSKYQQETNTTTYEYNSSGQVINDGYQTFEYGTHGKYIPRGAFHIREVGLVKNLTAIVTDNGRTSFKFDGNKLLVISSYGTNIDTAYVQYDGNYPVKINDPSAPNVQWDDYMTSTYFNNGMFKVFEEGFFSTSKDNPYRDSRKHYYKEDNEYLLLDKIVRSYNSSTEQRIDTETYTYNDKKDVTKIEEKDKDGKVIRTETYSYEYDTKGNWTKKTVSSLYDGQTEPYINITTREISYY